MRKKLLIFGGVSLLVLAGFAVYASLKGNPERKVADKFANYVITGDAAGSYSLFSDDAKKSQDQATWNTTVSRMSAIFKGIKPHYAGTTVGSSGDTITYDVSGSVGAFEFQIITVKDTDGSWKVFSFLSKQANSTPVAPQNSQTKDSNGSNSQ
jgi:hypothetical protein